MLHYAKQKSIMPLHPLNSQQFNVEKKLWQLVEKPESKHVPHNRGGTADR